MAKERFRETADYTVSAGPDGYCFRFYCAVSGALPCVAGPIRKGSQDTTLETAWQTVGGAISTSAIDAGDGFPMSCIMRMHWNAWNAPPGSAPCISARNAGPGIPAPDAASVYRERKNPGSTIKGSAGSAWNSMDLGRTL